MPRSSLSKLPASALALGLALSLSGCFGLSMSKKGEMLAKETFSADGTFSRTFEHTPAQVCEAARRALLSQGYVVARASPDIVEATKNFQPEADVHEQLQLRVSCVALASGAAWASASANQERYNLAKRNTSASVGVGGLGSLSVPIGSTDDSLVRVGSMTVQDPDFYRAFFKLVDRYLPAVLKLEPPKPPVEEQPAPGTQAPPMPQLWPSVTPIQWPHVPVQSAAPAEQAPPPAEQPQAGQPPIRTP